jgi:hypothetical protein
VLPDGVGWCNPGIATSWLGSTMPRGGPAVRLDDPDVYLDLVAQAAATSAPASTPEVV